MSNDHPMTTDINEPEPIGEPVKVDTTEEPCPNCGVVQRMDVYEQQYDGMPDPYFTDTDCPVCGHHIDMPW